MNFSESFSKNLGFTELWQARMHGFPKFLDTKKISIARELIRNGQAAYIRGGSDEISYMIMLKPENDSTVSARVVPALHFVTRHKIPRIEALFSILHNGFECIEAEDNAFILTDNHETESVNLGYPYDEGAYWPMQRGNALEEEDGIEVVGDSVRVKLWSGYTRYSYHARVYSDLEDLHKNKTCIWNAPVTHLEGVVVTALGSDWKQRIDYYGQYYYGTHGLAPLNIYGDGGNYLRIG